MHPSVVVFLLLCSAFALHQWLTLLLLFCVLPSLAISKINSLSYFMNCCNFPNKCGGSSDSANTIMWSFDQPSRVDTCVVVVVLSCSTVLACTAMTAQCPWRLHTYMIRLESFRYMSNNIPSCLACLPQGVKSDRDSNHVHGFIMACTEFLEV